MAISLECPTCGKAYQLQEDMAGRRAKCPCGEVLRVPAPATPSTVSDGGRHPVRRRIRIDQWGVRVAWVTTLYGVVAALGFLTVEVVGFSRTGFGFWDMVLPWWSVRIWLAGGVAGGGVLMLKNDKRGLEYAGLCSGVLCLFPFWTLFARGPSTVMTYGLGTYLGQLLFSIAVYSIPLGVTIWCWRQKDTADEA